MKLQNITWSKIKYYLIKNLDLIGVSVFFIFILYFNSDLKSKVDDLTLQNSVLSYQMISYRNSDSLHVAKIAVISSEKTKQFLKIQSKDSMILQLQQIIKKNKKTLTQPGSSTSLIDSQTSIKGVIPTTIEVKKTPVEKGEDFPEYTSSIVNSWIDLAISAKPDSTSFDLKVRNKYSVIIGQDKNGSFAEVTNYNPYTETVDMRTYSVLMPKKKKLSLGLHAGYGIVGLGFGPYMGIGLNYDLINLK